MPRRLSFVVSPHLQDSHRPLFGEDFINDAMLKN